MPPFKRKMIPVYNPNKKRKTTDAKQNTRLRKLERNAYGEIKIRHTSMNLAVASTGATLACSSIAAGTSDFARIGHQIRPTRISGRIEVRKNANTEFGFVRLLVTRSKRQVSDDVNLPSDVLLDASKGTLSFYNDDKNYEIIYDEKVLVVASGAGVPATYRNFSFNLKNKPVTRYNGTLGSDIESSGYNFMAISDTSSNAPVVKADIKFEFSDK